MDELNNILSKFGGTEQLWNYIKMYAAKGGREVTKTILELFYVMKSPNTGMIDKTLIGAALAYQLLPEDLMPRDKFGLLGFLDNGVTLAFAYNRVKKLVTPQIENQVKAMLDQWFGSEVSDQEDDFSGYAPSVIPVTPDSRYDSNQRNNRLQSDIRGRRFNQDDDVVID